MSIAVEPVSDAVGARVTNIDLREDMSPDIFKAVHQAMMDYQVLVFPGQEFNEEEQVRFYRPFRRARRA